ncbi:MAG: protein kinase, partial [Opitutaceae bacterium]
MKLSLSEAELITRALRLPVAERSAFLERTSREHPEFASRLPELVHALEAAAQAEPARPDSLASEGNAAKAFVFALAADVEETSGIWIGRYKLLQKLGEGGFGVVWMAEQHEPIRRRVAVKIIKTGMDTEEVIARFEAERQALALMEHPNIASVFDAGATSSGRPFFVMELVRGVAMTRYCDENRLSPEARLRLFVAVCHAVQHAHQKGVIHRDLKPSNILVTLHDGVPVPKIIDFGIAKATSTRLTERTLFTQFHVFIGTPAYTSPEQMEMSGLDIDTRSDIYSLGVLLYELLTGQPPFDSDALIKSGLEAMRRTIREVDPQRPSHRLGTLPEINRSSVAQQRGTNPAKLSLLLRGDLDWIAMRCLEKDRTRRYESAASLATDVERHLADAPVEARPPSAVYQARKFARRHRVGVIATAAVALSLVAGLVVASTLFVRERSAHVRAAHAEKQESELRQRAEEAHAAETKRVARTALDLANRNLADGGIADGLAHLVYAARKDPLNPTLAPRLASALAMHNFLLPQGAPFAAGSRILAVRFSHDGRSIFVGTEDGTFRTLDAASGAQRQEFRLGRKVALGGWTFARANESIVGVRFDDNTFGVYEAASGQSRLAPIALDPKVWSHSETMGLGASLGFSPDGGWIFALARREYWLWDTKGKLRLHESSAENVGSADFSPDRTTFTVTVGNHVGRWSLPDVTRAPHLPFRNAAPPGVAGGSHIGYSPDGRSFVVTDFTAGRIFDAATGALIRSLPNPAGYINPESARYLPSGRIFGNSDVRSGWWDSATGVFTSLPIPGGGNLSDVSFTSDGQRGLAVSSDGLIRIFDLRTGKLAAEPTWRQSGGFCAAISPDGTSAIIGTEAGTLLRFVIGQGPMRPLILPRSLNPP